MTISVQRNCCDCCDRKIGSRPKNPKSTTKPINGSRRTYQKERSRSGIGFTWAESAQPVSSRLLRITTSTRTSVARNK